MKISELNTDNALDVFCELVPYIENIISDKELISELKKKMNITEKTTNAEKTSLVMSKVKVITPVLLKKHRDDVIGIIASINGVPVESVKEQSFMKTLLQVREIITDKEFLDFFKSFAGLVEGA